MQAYQEGLYLKDTASVNTHSALSRQKCQHVMKNNYHNLVL